MSTKLFLKFAEDNPSTQTKRRLSWRQIGFLVALCVCLALPFSAAAALFFGIGVALSLGESVFPWRGPLTKALLGLSVVGLGAAMNIGTVGHAGITGLGYTIFFISFALIWGMILGRWLGIERAPTLLVSVGTAICGGSAIAAVSPVIHAKDKDITVSLATIFILNAIAMVAFPLIAQQLNLSQSQFGLWAALAIHDTGSVVGAAMEYGAKALEVATTVKLARALWIVPIAFGIGVVMQKGRTEKARTKLKVPWFIPGFLIAAALVTWLPMLRPIGAELASIAKKGLVVCLFLIGSGLSRGALRATGMKPMILGVLLWLSMAILSLFAILEGWIQFS